MSSVKVVLRKYHIEKGILVVDDKDINRSKNAKKLYNRVKYNAVQLDEMHCKIAKDRGFWLGAAIAMQSLLIVALTFGERNQGLADRLLAEIKARFHIYY